MQKYLATARMCLKQQNYFGLGEMLGQYLLRAVQMLAILSIWRALFRQGIQYENFTAKGMYAYTVLSSALYPLLNVRTPASSWLHDGTMLSLYQRPAPVIGQLVAHTVGGWLPSVLIYTIPVLMVSALAGIPLLPATPWFYLSLPLSVCQGFAVDLLFAALLMRMRNMEWTVHSIREALTVVLTGALIPFAVLPWRLGEWLSLSPLGTLAGAPLALYSGLDSSVRLIPAQLFWTAVLWPLAIACFRRSEERMVSYGG